jgi:hypothetical protein
MLNKISAIVRKKPLLFVGVLFTVFVVIIVIITLLLPKPDKYSAVDPASGETVSYIETGGPPAAGPEILGFDKLFNEKLSLSLNDVNNIKTVIQRFAHEKLPNTRRISLRTSSLSSTEETVSFNVAFNIDESEYKVSVKKSANSIGVSIYSLDNKPVFQLDNISSRMALSSPPYDSNTTDGNDSFIFSGLSTLSEHHSNSWVRGVTTTLKLYARLNNIKLEKISLVEGSWKEDTTLNNSSGPVKTTSFKVTGDKINLSVNIIEDHNTSIGLYDDNNLVFKTTAVLSERFIMVGNDLPNNMVGISPYKITLVNKNIPETKNQGLPPLKAGDTVTLYYACLAIAGGSGSGSSCRVYRYSFHY